MKQVLETMAIKVVTTGTTDRPYHVRHMFNDDFVERHDLEQYCWTRNTVCGLCRALCFNPNICCLATPSLAQAYFVQDPEQVVTLLDIDRRFSYLPGFQYWDIRHPEPLADHNCKTNFRVVVFDPPFFYIPMEELHRAVLEVCKGDTKTWLLIGFLVREERNLLNTFKEFKLMKTKFVLEYATVKPNKWRNYALYSNVDLPGIKRIQK